MDSTFPSDIPSYFADAESSFDESDIVIFGVKFDETASFRSGSRFGPDAIRKASWNFESFNFHTGVDLQDGRIHDYGNLLLDENINICQVIEKVQSFSRSIIEKNKIPVLLGGEHSLSAGVVQAFAQNIGVLAFDAHADFRNEYQDEAYNHACTLRRISDHVGDDHVFLCGLRSAGKQEYDDLKKHNISYIDTYTFHEASNKKIIEQIISSFNNKPVYVTIDIDVFDPAYAPGTGTPEPFGLNPIDVLAILDALSPQIIGFDVMEVNPQFDYGQTAFLGAKITRHLLEMLLKG
ncbi:MAG TPA: agmatinase [Candidatus Thermoplasmatota archaeon]|nr:agmatinase [Candidatus Thermoplasmatota archaeon]